MYIELCTLYHTLALHEEVWVEIFVIERYRLQRLDSSPEPGAVPLIVSHVQRSQAVVGDPTENALQESYS